VTVSEPISEHDGPRFDEELPSGAIDDETVARGSVYALAAAAFTEPSQGVYEHFADGSLDDAVATLVEQSGLDVEPPDLTVEDDRETLAARYNDLFVVGYSEVIDGTDGTVENQGPPVSLYESTYRSDVSWNDVNLDLARAYEHFGCGSAASAATTTTSDWSSSSRGISVGWPPRATTQTAVPTPPSQPTSTGRGSTSTTDTSPSSRRGFERRHRRGTRNERLRTPRALPRRVRRRRRRRSGGPARRRRRK